MERERDRLDAGLGMLLCTEAPDRDPEARRILRRLSAYLLAEEQCLYPALFVTLGSQTPLEPLTDHIGLKGLVAELMRMEAQEVSFAACVSNLQERLRAYGAHQQRCLYPLMHGHFSAGELQLIGGEMQLFLGANRRVAPGSGATAKALLEAVRMLLASPPRQPVHEQRRSDAEAGRGTEPRRL